MSGRGPTVVRKVAFTLEEKGRKRLGHKAEAVVVNGERIPRKVQLLAIAIRFEEILARGEVSSYAEIARICGVSRARVSQIMGLLDVGVGGIEAQLIPPGGETGTTDRLSLSPTADLLTLAAEVLTQNGVSHRLELAQAGPCTYLRTVPHR